MTKIKNKLSNEAQPAIDKPLVSGSFMAKSILERLIKKWKGDYEKILELTDKKRESKHQIQTANHFLIQLENCIKDAEWELKNCA